MIITIKNNTRQARVYQLDQRVASGVYKGHSETVIRVDHDANGNAQVRRKRLRHGPVLRLLAGEVREVPAAILHDSKLRRDTIGNRPPIKILRRESPEENEKRKAAEATAAAELQQRREAAAKQPKTKTTPGVKTAPQPQPEEKAGSDGDAGSSGGRTKRRNQSTE